MALDIVARKSFIVAKKEKESKVGEIITSTGDNQSLAEVIAVGSKITDVKVGDKIAHRGRLEVTLQGEKYLMLDDDEVLAVIKES